MRLFVTQNVGAGGRAGRAADHLHPPFKRVFAFSPEVVHVGLEMQLEYVVFVDVLGLRGDGERVAEQRQAGQGVIVLVRLVEEETEVREHHPQLLPPVAVLEFPQQIPRQLILHGDAEVHHGDAGVAVPAHVHHGVAAVRGLALQRGA